MKSVTKKESKSLFQGQGVTCKKAVEAYYSNYGGNPVMIFHPNMRGEFQKLAPKVRGKNEDFAVVDYYCPITEKTQRVGLDISNLLVIQ